MTTSETKTSANDELADLLSQEDILSKVLVHLVDSGLHECRRVCRKWYEVCNKLPVKLSLGLRDDRCVDPDKFPNAVSLKLRNDISWNLPVIENHLLPCLSKLKHFTHLEFSITHGPLFLFPQDYLPALHSVRSLSLTVQTESDYSEVLRTLRRLTDLRALKLDRRGVFRIMDMAPITEIRNLRKLSAKLCFLFNRENQFIFGTQTQLTRLEVLKDVLASGLTRVTLQVMSAVVYYLSDCFSCRRSVSTPQVCAL